MSGSVTAGNGKTIVFKRDDISILDLGDAAKAYAALIMALEKREPTYEEFIDYLVRASHAEPKKDQDNVPPTHKQ